jgi:hypothetical protein
MLYNLQFVQALAALSAQFSPEERQASFQQLLRLHLNTFNHRLSMLESNTLDMKDSIRLMTEQQGSLSTQLEGLAALRPVPERQGQVEVLERSYGDMGTRLSRLEGRLEILIDGFTALAQEMNKMKRHRHQERRAEPVLHSGPFVPFGSPVSPEWDSAVVTVTGRPLMRAATSAQSIPPPRVTVRRPTSTAAPDRRQRLTAVRLPVKKSTKVTRSHVVIKHPARSKVSPGKSREGSEQKTQARATPVKKGETSKGSALPKTTTTTERPQVINKVKERNLWVPFQTGNRVRRVEHKEDEPVRINEKTTLSVLKNILHVYLTSKINCNKKKLGKAINLF